MTPHEFLESLWAEKPSDLYILIWTLQNKHSRWFQNVEDAAAFVESCRDQDVYVGVGLSPEDFGPHQRCPADKIAGIGAVWADLDVLSEAHSKKALPASLKDALTIIPEQVPPTLTVSTGNGGHLWWIFKEPFIFECEQDRRRAASVVYRWQTLLRFNAANRGWSLDRLADLPRVMRIPGTQNFKDPAHPRDVTVLQTTGRRFELSDLEEILDDLGIPEAEAQEYSARRFTIGPTDNGLVINLNAEIAEEKIKRWAETDLRFRNTWFRQRHDLKDQSQSGYDLALAHFGIDAGLDKQQIVDLIIHHRRLHRQKPRTRADYYDRTLARAAERNGNGGSIAVLATTSCRDSQSNSIAEDPADPSPGSAPEPPVDPMAAKAALCEFISAQLGVRILRLVKITGKEPTYQIELDNGRIEITNVAKLIDQRALRIAIAGSVNRIIPKIKPKLWERLAQAMLDALIEQEGGVETEFEGSMRVYLGHYLTETAFIPSIEGQPSHAVRRPMLIDGHIAVNSLDLQLYVNKTFAQSLSVKAVASMLSAIGARSIRVRGPQVREQGRWLLPLDQFDPAEFTQQTPHPAAQEESRAQ
jgi:hypothetical protein